MKSTTKEHQIENPKLLITFIGFFLVSVLFIAFAMSRGTNTESISGIDEETETEGLIESEDLNEYFKSDPGSEVSSETTDNPYLQADPFRETCQSAGQGEGQSISFGTVCLN